MALLSKNTELLFTVNGKDLQPPTEWQGISVNAQFDNGQPQGSVTTTEFTFILDAYTELKQHIASGFIFEGIDFEIQSYNEDTSLTSFKGFIDLVQSAVINDTEGNIKAFAETLDGVPSFESRLEGLEFRFLYDINFITDSDFTTVEYQVLPINQAEQAIFLSLTLLALGQQIESLITDVTSTIAELAADGANPLTANVAIGKAISLAIKIAFGIALINETIKVFKQLANTLNPPVREHKCMSFQTLLEKVCDYLGYDFNTSIPLLEKIYYLPSNLAVDEFGDRGFLKKVRGIEIGLPNVNDYGSRCSDFFELVMKMFNARYAIVDGVVQLHTELSNYWIKTSTWHLPSILEPPYSYNTEELKSNILIKFSTDLKDEYTIDNFRGTSYSIFTDQITTQDEKKKLIRGFEDISFPLALGNRKNELTGVEKFLAFVAGVLDGIIRAITFTLVRTTFKDDIKSRIGVLKVSEDNHNVAKALYLEGSKLPVNQRDLFSAKVLWESGINEKSFIENNFRRQRQVFTGVEIPFGLVDFVQLINNAYFTTSDNRIGKVENIDWSLAEDKAVIDYYIEEQYTDNLQETYLEDD